MAKRKLRSGDSGGTQDCESVGEAKFWPSFLVERPLPIAEPSACWCEFAEAHQGHPALSEDTIYALPTPLINAIDTAIHGFFEEEEQFERDLARLAGPGFFLRQPIAYEPMPGPEPDKYETKQDQELRRRQLASDAQIRDLLSDEMRRSGRSEEEIDEYWKMERQMHERIDDRKWGYAGWVVTHPEFHAARRKFRLKWESRIRELGGIPAMPMSFTGAAPSSPPEEDRKFWVDCQIFYREWALHGLATWELPVPMRPETVGPSLYFLPHVREAGITLFVPWYLLRDKDLKVREIAEHRLNIMSPAHLQDWLEGKSRNWGYERYALMLKLYVYIELCLKARHASRMKGQIESLDHAFGHFFRGELASENARLAAADSIKKVRQEMQRRLKMCSVEEADE